MDSMRSLNTSLPRTRRRQPTPQLDTNQSFRTAALTVTNLYKAALADIDRSRIDGYQDALEDLIGFLDKENLGVSSGEGWRIRQWVTERQSGSLPANSASDSDEEILDEQRARSSSPVIDRETSPEEVRTEPTASTTHQRSQSAPIPPPAPTPTADGDLNHAPIFHFTSAQPLPSNNATENPSYDVSAAARRAFPTPRRSLNRATARNLQRSAAQNVVSLGSGAGQKRKLMQDFFNIDFNDRRDGPGGGSKRGRMS